MKKLVFASSSTHRQQGVALVVSLILLTVITLLGLTSMRSANLDTKISVNHQHKQFAFQAAENALTKLTTLQPSEMQNLSVPGTVDAAAETNTDWYAQTSVTGSADISADLSMDLTEISNPGQYKFSGFGLSVVTVVYQADATGTVDGTNATARNRMEVALVRD